MTDVRVRTKRLLGPSGVQQLRRLSRFPAFRVLIHPDPEVRRWNARAWRTAMRTHFKVASGPFKGMDLKPIGDPGPMTIRELLGIYEEELHPWIEILVSHGYKDVVDIGAARGYYAVGLALRMPSAHVIAFEQEKTESDILMRIAQVNGVSDRVALQGQCDRRALEHALRDREGALIVCDCEGGEFGLLDVSGLPALVSCDLLVEVHGFGNPALRVNLERRYQSSHWLFRMMPSRGESPVGTTRTRGAQMVPRIPRETRPDGAYWLLLLRRGVWSPRTIFSAESAYERDHTIRSCLST